MTTICHFSDWHGDLERPRLPEADVYVSTGDMLPNFLELDFEMSDGSIMTWCPNDWAAVGPPRADKPDGRYVRRRVVRSREAELQRLWITKVKGDGGLRERLLGSPDAPVVCVRGNHDFTDLAPLFDGGLVVEMGEVSGGYETLAGLRFAGCRGVQYHGPEWNDNLPEHVFDERASRLPLDVDVLVTHSPPRGFLDRTSPAYGSVDIGSLALASYLNRQAVHGDRPLRAHFFGHNHDGLGTMRCGATIFSNAATGFHVLEV